MVLCSDQQLLFLVTLRYTNHIPSDAQSFPEDITVFSALGAINAQASYNNTHSVNKIVLSHCLTVAPQLLAAIGEQ